MSMDPFAALAMKRGVPPTARKARTGEFTPPGMTLQRFLSNRACAFVRHRGVVSGHGAGSSAIRWPRRRPRRSIRLRRARRLRLPRPSSPSGGMRPEETVGHHVAHAGAKARVEGLVEEGQGLAHGGVQLDAGGQEGRERGRERVTGTDEGGFEALELLAGDGALRVGENVVEELVRKGHARHEHVARAVLGRCHGDLARRRRALAAPLGQQEIGQRLVAADEHLGLWQHQVAECFEIGLLIVFFDPREIGQVGDQGHVGIVGQDLGDGAHAFGRAEEADLPRRDGHVFEDAPRLLDDDVGIDRVVVEDLGRVAHDDARDNGQRVCAHGRDGRDVACEAACAARVVDIEAHDAGRCRLLFERVGGSVCGGGWMGSHGMRESRW